MPNPKENDLESRFVAAAARLEELRNARRGGHPDVYEIFAGGFRSDVKELLLSATAGRECTCILRAEDRERHYPGTTVAECAAAATQYGFEWEWKCED